MADSSMYGSTSELMAAASSDFVEKASGGHSVKRRGLLSRQKSSLTFDMGAKKIEQVLTTFFSKLILHRNCSWSRGYINANEKSFEFVLCNLIFNEFVRSDVSVCLWFLGQSFSLVREEKNRTRTFETETRNLCNFFIPFTEKHPSNLNQLF